ncbi:MAG: hypothetical protein AB7U63_09980 [Porticoccaceae bacterium]
MIKRAKTILAKHATQLPIPAACWLMTVNRSPGIVFGSEYRKYRQFLDLNRLKYDNRQLLLNSVNDALRHVPYYNRRYGSNAIKSLEMFEGQIDFINKDSILNDYEAFINPKVRTDEYDVGTTGGTSGKPLTFIAPKNRYVVELATMHSLWENVGYDFSVRAVMRNHRLPANKDYIVNPITREIIFDGFRLNDAYFEQVYSVIKRKKIRFIHCYPSTAYELSVFFRNTGKDVSFLKAFLSGSENIFDYQRTMIENELGVRFYNWYGHSEKLVLAGYCPHTHHYHAEPTYGYFELVDDMGRIIQEKGATGEIVGTSFHNPGMPLIRYRTGDFAEYVGDHCEACGRTLPVFKAVRGRWNGERIFNADGSFVTTTALNLHSELYQVINGLQYVQPRKGLLIVLIIKTPSYTQSHESALYFHFKDKLGTDTEVLIRYVERLLRKPNGKFLQLMSQIDEEGNLTADKMSNDFFDTTELFSRSSK